MKNNLKKLISLILAVAMCISMAALVACGGGTDQPVASDPAADSSDAGNESESGGEETTPPEEEIKSAEIALSLLSEYYVVRPDVQNADIIAAAKNIDNAITEVLGVRTKGITTDFIYEGLDMYSEHEYEIIIGETNRDATAEFLSELEYLEYGYAIIGTKIVISGMNVEDTVTAVDKFIEDVIYAHTEGSDKLFFAQEKYICQFDHKFDTLKINGVDISEFDIIYKKTKAFQEADLVTELQDMIGRLSGYKPRAVLINTSSSNKEKHIVITDSNTLTDEIKNSKASLLEGVDASAKSVIMVDENNVWLSGDNLAALLDSFTQLVAQFNASTDGSITLESGIYDVTNPQIKVMSYNVFVGTNTEAGLGAPRERKYGIVKTINNYAPDVIGVQEASTAWMSMLKVELRDTYDYVGIGRESGSNTSTLSNGEACAIFYNKEKYTVVESNTYWLTDTPNKQSMHPESSYIRIMTYAIFERKSDGFRFMHVNTHLDFGNNVQIAQVNKMLELITEVGFEGLTFVTGDFNMTPSASAYQLMLEAGFENSFDVANISSETSIASMIDFCFVRDNTSNVKVEKHHVANDAADKVYNDRFPSDHCAVIATVVPVLPKED